MRFAVISDIHSNYAALDATLKDIESQGVDKICCLGDLLGYGPNPLECVDRIMELIKKEKLEVCLLGNHDQATLFNPEGFNPLAEEAVFWTREKLESARGLKATARWDFIGERPMKYKRDCFLFVHGSPRNPLNEYVFPEDYADKDKMSKLFAATPQYCFMGHTHVPGIFTDRTELEDYQYFSHREIQEKFGGKYPLGKGKLLINVGSIGQPRDKNPNSRYVIVQYDENSSDNCVEYRSVQYDVQKTIDDFLKVPELAKLEFLYKRLEQGR